MTNIEILIGTNFMFNCWIEDSYYRLSTTTIFKVSSFPFFLRIHRNIKSRFKVITSFKLLWSLKHNIAKGQLERRSVLFSKKGYFKYSPSSNKNENFFRTILPVWYECIPNRYVLYRWRWLVIDST